MKKQIVKKHPEGFIRINISTDGCAGRPYFSITADLCKNTSFSDFGIFSCGCLHEDVLRVCPELKPFVALHLSDINGVPMHAVENGFYWLCKAAGIPQQYGPEQDAERCGELLESHLRVGYPDAVDVIAQVAKVYEEEKEFLISQDVTQNAEKLAVNKAKEHFKLIVDSMKDRWQNEATQAIKMLEKLP